MEETTRHGATQTWSQARTLLSIATRPLLKRLSPSSPSTTTTSGSPLRSPCGSSWRCSWNSVSGESNYSPNTSKAPTCKCYWRLSTAFLWLKKKSHSSCMWISASDSLICCFVVFHLEAVTVHSWCFEIFPSNLWCCEAPFQHLLTIHLLISQDEVL